MSVRVYGKSVASYDDWASNTAYEVDDECVPTESNGKCYKCTVAGISGSVEPIWPKTNDATIDDFDTGQEEDHVIWKCQDYAEEPAPLSLTIDKEGYGGFSMVDVWVKSDGEVHFDVEVSQNGVNWRELDGINVNDKAKLEQYTTAYRYVKVYTEDVASNEIEIVAGGA
jgi:hypothetical protein